ncbi:MAG: DUF5671 domain-containing protein [bacterium]|nr:DUF5671 domain-containing protein [bacterium]
MDEQLATKTKTTPKDVFLHLLMIGTLYTSAISFIALLFQYINRFIPDPLQYYEQYGINQSIRWSLAALVIVFPVFLWIARHLEKDFAAHMEKQQLAIRRWLLNLTLFIAAITIIVDLITLIYNYLGGELTTRFLLKILVVLAVAVGIFTYYIWELRREASGRSAKMRNLGNIIMAIVALVAIGGFIIAGSPRSERLRRFDQQRVSDLQSIQYQIVDYWQRKQQLPDSIDILRNDLAGYIPPQDPERQQPYTYRKKGDLAFELCAAFTLPSDAMDAKYSQAVPRPVGPFGEQMGEAWEHGAGEKCFERTIDPQLYPPYNQQAVPPKF